MKEAWKEVERGLYVLGAPGKGLDNLLTTLKEIDDIVYHVPEINLNSYSNKDVAEINGALIRIDELISKFRMDCWSAEREAQKEIKCEERIFVKAYEEDKDKKYSNKLETEDVIK